MPKNSKLAKRISQEYKKSIESNELRGGPVVNRSAQTLESIFSQREEDEQIRWTGVSFFFKKNKIKSVYYNIV